MEIYHTLAANIYRADVVDAWGFYFILIVLYSLVAIYRRVNYSAAVVSAFVIILLSLARQLLLADASGPCPHYGEYGFYIVIAILCFIYACAFYGRSTKRKIFSLYFVLLAALSLCLIEKNVIRDTYRVIVEGQKIFKSI